MNNLRRRNWNEGIEVHELRWMNWNEWIEMNDLRWMNSDEWKKWMNWIELSWVELNWSDGIDWLVDWLNEWMKWNIRAMWLTWWWFCWPHLPKVLRAQQSFLHVQLEIELYSCVPDLLGFPTTWWRCGCHDDWDDDVFAMMVRKLAMTIVRKSEVS